MAKESRRSQFLLFTLQLFFLFFGALFEASASSSIISGVNVSASYFNPSVNQRVEITFNLEQTGHLTVLILDRDGFPIKSLTKDEWARKGKQKFVWTGVDDQNRVVADEAYSIKIDLRAKGGVSSYFPANKIFPHQSIIPEYYHRKSGILSYRLNAPSRMHIQAGVAKPDPKTKEMVGPIMKTIVNRQVRSVGRIIENYSGWDESGTIHVSELPNFVVAIAAQPLAENSIITVGNRHTSFLDYVQSRQGKSLFTYSVEHHGHHAGLSTLDDLSPSLKLAVMNGTWNSTEKVWEVAGDEIRIKGSLEGVTSKNFARQPGDLAAYVNQDLVFDESAPKESSFEITVMAHDLGSQKKFIVVNRGSEYGGCAMNSFYVRKVPGKGSGAVAQRGGK